MPLYEYECDAEGRRFEVIQKFSDERLTSCPTCGAPVRRLLSSPAIQFKGSGWYITDYARKGTKDGATKGDGNSGDGAAKKDATDGTSSEKAAKKVDAPSAPASTAPGSDT